ncbi:YmfQ family protein [Cupriavidus respiraculi]|uniref:DUF2313 domain-containing protein n=1 Tax=Cupriavidus respiraculi TaxID=195930 RepID=A0ABM8WXS8_9BURK|nr:putative phage tail protein [Cupriavidus respiraculi]CAG9172368.1 hypothetical protein LMG21510_01951 [Cupriavidus respiraculi]
MALTEADYLDHLLGLLPRGPAWPRGRDAITVKQMDAVGTELARIDARVDDLLDEADPRTTTQLLGQWEALFGLPDPCLTPATSIADRRGRLLQRIVFQGGQSMAFFTGLLNAMGYAGVTVTEFRPFRANSKCNSALNQGGWRNAWRVNVPAEADVRRMKANSRCNEPLASWGDPGLYCLLAQYKPAHTILFIGYGDT